MNVTISQGGNATTILIDNTVRLMAANPTSFQFIQSVPSKVWHINHKLKKYPSITITDPNGIVVDCDRQYIDLDNVTATFSADFIGIAYLN